MKTHLRLGHHYIGQIELFPTPPRHLGYKNYIVCDGRSLPIGSYASLFTIIGNTFGGVPNQTFALPDLRGKVPAPGMNYYMRVNGSYPAEDIDTDFSMDDVINRIYRR